MVPERPRKVTWHLEVVNRGFGRRPEVICYQRDETSLGVDVQLHKRLSPLVKATE